MTLSGIIRLVASAALVAALTITIAACESNPSTSVPATQPVTPTPISNTPTPVPTSTLPTPTEILRETTSAMLAIQSVSAETEITVILASDDGVTGEMRIMGDLQTPDRYHFTTTVKSLDRTGEVEIIAIGTQYYMKYPAIGQWEANTGDGTVGVALTQGAFRTDLAPDAAAAFELVGAMELENERVYHLRGHVSGNNLAYIGLGYLIEDQSNLNAEGELQYWIGIDDFLVRRTEVFIEEPVRITDTNADTDNRTIHAVTVLSDYNSGVEIVAPEIDNS